MLKTRKVGMGMLGCFNLSQELAGKKLSQEEETQLPTLHVVVPR